jgi:hypothetical protein
MQLFTNTVDAAELYSNMHQELTCAACFHQPLSHLHIQQQCTWLFCNDHMHSGMNIICTAALAEQHLHSSTLSSAVDSLHCAGYRQSACRLGGDNLPAGQLESLQQASSTQQGHSSCLISSK